tara:strand:+ start:682 stop:2418 length:1737 start_codon:yes stop_codon:yes gene_type:complete
MGEIRDYNVSADSNTATPPDGAPEGMAPSTVNNTMREAYARIKRFYNDTNGANTTAGSGNTYTLSASRTVATYAAGDMYVAKFNHSNTGNATLNVDSVGAKSIVTPSLNELPVNSIRANGVYAVVYEASADKFILLDSHPSENQINLKNPDSEDTAGGRESQIVFKGLQSGSEESTLGRIQASHEGTSDDQKGQLIFSTNDGSDSDAPTTAMTIASDQTVTFAKNPVGVSAGITKNYILNPEFAYSQRGISINSTTPSSGSNSHSVAIIDMYRLVSDGDDIVDINQTQTEAPSGSKTAIELLVPSDASTTNKKFGILQFLENVNCESIIGQEVTLSAQIKAASDLDDVRMAIISWSGDEDLPAISSNNFISAWESEGINPTLASNYAYEHTPSDLNVTTSYAKYSVTATIDTANTKNVAIFIWSNVTGTTAGTSKLHIGQVMLEKGNTASDFVFPEFSEVINSCRRYLHFMVADGTSTIQDNGVFANGHFFTTAARCERALTTPMRVAPTITGSNIKYLGVSSGTVTGFNSELTAGRNITMMSFNVTYSTNSSMFSGCSARLSVGSGGFFIMTAELGA